MEKKKDFHHLLFTNSYLNAPCYTGKVYLRLLEEAVCIIGREFGVVNGSDKKKGVHYIAKKVDCHKRQVKLMLQSVPAQIIRENGTPAYVFRCHIENYCSIYECILKYLVYAHDDNFYMELQKESEQINTGMPEFSDLLILRTINALHCLEIEGTKESVRKTALHMQEEIKAKDKAYPFVSSI